MSNVLDASAILAYLQREKGSDVIEAALDAGPTLVTTVNFAEVLGKLHEKGMPLDEARLAFDSLGTTLVAFDASLALLCAKLRPRTLSIGASLGDRACLALAQKLSQDAPAGAGAGHAPMCYTAEHAWAKVHWPFKLVVIR